MIQQSQGYIMRSQVEGTHAQVKGSAVRGSSLGAYGFGGSVFTEELKMYKEEFKAEEVKSGSNG